MIGHKRFTGGRQTTGHQPATTYVNSHLNMTVDFYDLLGIDRDASQEEVRRAFRDQVREYHPDRNEDPRAPAQFTAIKKAYETLGDSKEREDYDRMGHNSYCAKRINGLPSAEEWQLPDQDETGAPQPASTTGDASSGSAAKSARNERSASTESRASGSGDDRTTAGGSRGRSSGTGDQQSRTDPWTNDGPTANATWANEGVSSTGERSSARNRSKSSAPRGRSTARTSATGAGTARSGSATGSRPGSNEKTNPAGSKASAAAAGGGGGSSGTPTGSGGSVLGDADPLETLQSVFNRVRRASIGWPLIVVSNAMYLVGLSMYFRQNYAEVELVAAELVAAATGEGSVGSVLGSPPEFVSLSQYIQSSIWAGSAFGGILLILGVAFLPSVYFFIIRETRKIQTPWRPSYLYVIGVLGPVTGLLLTGVATFPGLYLEVLCYVVLPLSSIFGLPFSAFVRPRIVRAVRKTRHRLVG